MGEIIPRCTSDCKRFRQKFSGFVIYLQKTVAVFHVQSFLHMALFVIFLSLFMVALVVFFAFFPVSLQAMRSRGRKARKYQSNPNNDEIVFDDEEL